MALILLCCGIVMALVFLLLDGNKHEFIKDIVGGFSVGTFISAIVWIFL